MTIEISNIDFLAGPTQELLDDHDLNPRLRNVQSNVWWERIIGDHSVDHRQRSDLDPGFFTESGVVGQQDNLTRRADHQAQGWPIGSDIMESGNKLVLKARLKGPGMHWVDLRVNSMLALRNIVYSSRWKEDWPRIEQRLRQRASQQRQRLDQSRR